MHFNLLHHSVITKDGYINWSFHLVNVIKLTSMLREMTPMVMNFSIKDGHCDSHANRLLAGSHTDNLSRDNPTTEEGWVITLSVCGDDIVH